MFINTIQRNTPNKPAKRIGRGGKRGKTSGKGHKGQKARAGNSIRPNIRDIIKKLPKQRGYRFNSFKPKAVVVNVAELDAKFAANDEVTPETLTQHGLISLSKSRNNPVKILGNGNLTKALSVTGCVVSAAAKTKIESAGGSIR